MFFMVLKDNSIIHVFQFHHNISRLNIEIFYAVLLKYSKQYCYNFPGIKMYVTSIFIPKKVKKIHKT